MSQAHTAISALSALANAGPAYAFSAHLVAALRDAGVTHFCICPGSRSAPTAAAAAGTPGVRCWMHHDERSAAFFALGLVRACAMPVALLCTSGTAAANFAPAVAEASRSSLPLVVLTADRPRRLRARGAPQTIDQVRLYGSHARAFYEQQPGADMERARRRAQRLARRLLRRALGARPGPVHANLAFEEPLEPIFSEASAQQTAPHANTSPLAQTAPTAQQASSPANTLQSAQPAPHAQTSQSAQPAPSAHVQSGAPHQPGAGQVSSAHTSPPAQTSSFVQQTSTPANTSQSAHTSPSAHASSIAQTSPPVQQTSPSANTLQSAHTSPPAQTTPGRTPGTSVHPLKAALRLSRARRAVRAALARSKRPVFVAGPLEIDAESAELLRRLAERLGAPLLAEPLSQLRSGVPQGRAGGALVAAGDALLRCSEFAQRMQPDLVIRLGAPPTGRALSRWLAQHRDAPLLALHTPGAWWRDPERRATHRFTVEPAAFVRALFADVMGETAASAATEKAVGAASDPELRHAPAATAPELHRAAGDDPELRHGSDSEAVTNAATATATNAAPAGETAASAATEKSLGVVSESELRHAAADGPELRHASSAGAASSASTEQTNDSASDPELRRTPGASESELLRASTAEAPGARHDPARQGPTPAAEAGWLARWQRAERRAWQAVQQSARARGALLPAAFAALADALPEDGVLFLASSLAVRDAETFLPPRAQRLRFAANRGANGIDGVLSTACGMAAAGAEVGLVIGDLALLHDIGALFTVQRLRIPLRIVVLNDGGGGIFDHLPLAAHKNAVAFEQVFRLAHDQSLVPPARAFGIPAQRCSNVGELKAALGAEGPCLVELPLEPAKNLALHRAAFAAVAHAVSAES